MNGRLGPIFGTYRGCVKERTVASRPSRSKKPKQPAWEIYRLKGSPAAFVGRLRGSPTAFVGVVYAEDEEGAINLRNCISYQLNAK